MWWRARQVRGMNKQATCRKYHEGRFGGRALKGRHQHTHSRHCPATSRSSQGKTTKWSAEMSSK